jgi:hypothetical protein
MIEVRDAVQCTVCGGQWLIYTNYTYVVQVHIGTKEETPQV